MRWSSVYVAGVGTHLPPPVSAREAIESGRYAVEDFEDDQQVSALESSATSPVDMAVAAGRQALSRSGHTADDIDLVLHCSIHYQGEELWAPASYVQRHTVANRAPAIDVNQASNGGMAGLELAASWLTGRDAAVAALITVADRFALPGTDRWSTESGMVLGDAATGLVLSKRPGPARLVATHSVADSELEEAFRSDDARFLLEPAPQGQTVDMSARRRPYLERFGLEFMVERLEKGLLSTVDRTLADANTTMDAVTRVIVPNVGRKMLEWEFLLPLKIDEGRTVWDLGRRVGHMGASDQFAGIAHLVESGQVQPGDQVLVVGAGIGFSWTAALLEIRETPDWSESAGTLFSSLAG